MAEPGIHELAAEEVEQRLDDLAAILHATVNAGASVSFVLPHSLDDSRAFWRQTVLPSAKDGGRIVLLALAEGQAAGTVQLITALPQNQPHRCEAAKLLVHPDFRRRGIAKALMAALEDKARALGKRLITLDTTTGDNAEPLYASLGFQTAGVIPEYSRHPVHADRYDATTYMYKLL